MWLDRTSVVDSRRRTTSCLTIVWMHHTLMRTPTTDSCRSGEADLLVTSETASRDFSHGSPHHLIIISRMRLCFTATLPWWSG